MSEGQLPAYVDTRRAFLQDSVVEGAVSLDRLPRFREMLANDQANVTARLAFTVNNEGQRQITGNLSLNAEVPCQRCLEPAPVELEEEIRLILVDSEAAAAALKPEWDPWIFKEFKLQLAEIVEEQLILSLPVVHFHSDPNCIENLDYKQTDLSLETIASGEERDDNPFAVLASLKEKRE